jgi:DnaJ-class molecular chaperone
MLCPECRGQGVVSVARFAIDTTGADVIGGTGLVHQDCGVCDGEGWLPFAGIAPSADRP